MKYELYVLYLLVEYSIQFRNIGNRLSNWPIKIEKIETQSYLNEIRELYNKTLKRVGESIEIPNVQCNIHQFGLITTNNVSVNEILYSIPLNECISIDYVESVLFGGGLNLDLDDSSLLRLIENYDIYRQSYIIAKKTLELLTLRYLDCNELPIHITANEAKIFILAYGLSILIHNSQLNNPNFEDYLNVENDYLPILMDNKILELSQDRILINKVMRYRRCLNELAHIPFGANEFLSRIDRELGLSVYRDSDTFSPKGPILEDFKTRAQNTLVKLSTISYQTIDNNLLNKFNKLLYKVFSLVCRYNIWPGFKCTTDPIIADGASGIHLDSDIESSPLIIPFMGFCNHSIESNAMISVSSDKKSVNLIARHSIPLNKPITINYGNYPNYLFYLNYGFIPSYNPHNIVYIEADPESILKAANDIGYADKLPSCFPRGLPIEKLNLIDKLNIFDKVDEIDWKRVYNNPYYNGIPLLTYQEHLYKFGDKDILSHYLNPQPQLDHATRVNLDDLICEFKPTANRFLWIKPNGAMDSRLMDALKIALCRKKSELNSVLEPGYTDEIACEILTSFLKYCISDRFYKTHIRDVEMMSDDYGRLMALYYSLSIKLQILNTIVEYKN